MLYSSSSKVAQNYVFGEAGRSTTGGRGSARAHAGRGAHFWSLASTTTGFRTSVGRVAQVSLQCAAELTFPRSSLALSVPTFPCRSCPHWVFSCFCRLTLYKSRQSVKAAMTPLKRHRQHPETAKARRLCMSVEAAVLVSRPTKKEAGNSVRGLGTPNSCQSVATSVTR